MKRKLSKEDKQFLVIMLCMFGAAAAMTAGYAVEKRMHSAEDITVMAVVEESEVDTETMAAEYVVGDVSVGTEAHEPVNINTAQKWELVRLDGIGEKTAEAIIEYRKKTPFESVEDIMNVDGIGEKKFEAIRDDICV